MSGYVQGNELAAGQQPAAGAAPVPTKALASKAVTIPALNTLRASGEKITMLTCYDASFAALMDRCGVEVLLIGDSLAWSATATTRPCPVTVEEIAYHTAAVARGSKSALVLADMPFGSYATPEAAFNNAVKLMQAGAHMVKIEGGAWLADTVRFLTERSIPVCAHLGLTPQSVHQLGGYKVQGKTSRKRRPAQGRRPQTASGRRRAAGAGSDPDPAGQGSHRPAGDSHHRHRRGPGLLRPGTGECTTCWASSRPQSALREELHGRPDQHRRRHQRLRQRRQGRQLPSAGTLLLNLNPGRLQLRVLVEGVQRFVAAVAGLLVAAKRHGDVVAVVLVDVHRACP